MLLNNGQRVESSTTKPGLKISEFKQYGTALGQASGGSPDQLSVKSMSTRTLLEQPLPVYRAELGWRLGLASSVSVDNVRGGMLSGEVVALPPTFVA